MNKKIQVSEHDRNLLLHVAKRADGFIYLRDIPPPYDAEFSRWLWGQTCPVSEDRPNEDCAYEWDWKRWVERLTSK